MTTKQQQAASSSKPTPKWGHSTNFVVDGKMCVDIMNIDKKLSKQGPDPEPVVSCEIQNNIQFVLRLSKIQQGQTQSAVAFLPCCAFFQTPSVDCNFSTVGNSWFQELARRYGDANDVGIICCAVCLCNPLHVSWSVDNTTQIRSVGHNHGLHDDDCPYQTPTTLPTSTLSEAWLVRMRLIQYTQHYIHC